MFTGIITHLGTITSLKTDGDLTAIIQADFNMADVALGASIACSGICLTVVDKSSDSFTVNISAETLRCTNIADVWQVGGKINLERALKMGDELGGHIVSGHVDGVATLETLQEVDGCRVMEFCAPENLAMFIAAKGSITIDGVSLTVNEVIKNYFEVNIIPHTLTHTTLGNLSKGSKVNLEIDMLARYVQRLVSSS